MSKIRLIFKLKQLPIFVDVFGGVRFRAIKSNLSFHFSKSIKWFLLQYVMHLKGFATCCQSWLVSLQGIQSRVSHTYPCHCRIQWNEDPDLAGLVGFQTLHSNQLPVGCCCCMGSAGLQLLCSQMRPGLPSREKGTLHWGMDPPRSGTSSWRWGVHSVLFWNACSPPPATCLSFVLQPEVRLSPNQVILS